jgi:SPP1 gp7 family putative phage head morphogenesis protein
MLGLEVDTAGKPWLDEGFLPFNLMPAGEVASQTVPEPALLPVPAEDETADAAKGVVPFHLRGSKRRLAFIRSLEALWEGTARAYRLRYQSWLYGLRTETLAALDAVSGTAASAAAAAGGIRSVSVRALEDPETVMFDLDAAAGDLVQTSMPSWKQGLKIGGKSVIDELSIDGTFDMDAAEAQAFLKVKTFKIKVEHQIVGVVHERVRRAIAAGIAEREDIQAIKDRVREAFNVERARSLAIARTEVGQSFAGGRFIEMQGEGVKRHQWLTAGDDAVRESHEDMDGEIQVIGEEFSNGLLYPLQANSNDAGEVVNCRCAAVAVLE